MRIRKKTPKPSAKRPPLYFIGYRGTAPSTDELVTQYEREYGGPLSIRHEAGSPESWQATHGPWSAHVVMPLPASHVAEIMKQLAWEHPLMGAIAPSLAPPRDMPDAVLLGARLARCLTLLTQGTAYDVTTQDYLNPSDWQNRALTTFLIDDHLSVAQDETARPDHVWFYSGQAYPLDPFPGFETTSCFGDGQVGAYTPSLPEIALAVGGLGIVFLITHIGARLFDFLPRDEALPATGGR